MEANEARAAANALHAALHAGMIDRDELVVIRCDNKHVVDRFGGKKYRRPPKPDLKAAIAYLREFARANGFRISVRYVRGHSPPDSPCRHEHRNRRADKLCSVQIGTKRPGITPLQLEKRAEVGNRIARLKRLGDNIARLTGKHPAP